MITAVTAQLDPVKYEMFLHRLWAIGEEGRTSLQQVTASPIVSQGGECMSSFYNKDGVMVLACSGHLRFAAATSDAIKKLIEWYGESPGFFDGDQLFFNDPYIAGAHTYDMMIVKPMFHDGELIGWLASSIHTADTGGVMRGLATEIFHEGIRIQGLKLVEKGEFREDVFRCITEQCRDPGYVGLDMKSMITSNNVCSKRYLELVDKFGVDFIQMAGEKIIEDSERMARAKLRGLPNGTWASHAYGTAWDRVKGGVQPYLVACTMTKQDDELSFDFTGSSAQMTDTTNSSWAGTMAQLAVVLTDFLFWDVPWSDGKFAPVKSSAPVGSILNCTFPAACGGAPGVGVTAKMAASECIAKMLYAGGQADDINAPWQGIWYSGGPLSFYGGHNRAGLVTAQGLYDGHGSGLGATPDRDGVPCGGNMNIPSGGISDVERIEMQYPFLYFTRNFHRDGGGAGKFIGGAGSYRMYMIYGSQDTTVNYMPYGGIPEGAGLFGGLPSGVGGTRGVFHTEGASIVERLKKEPYPIRPEQLESEGWGKVKHSPEMLGRSPLPEYSIVTDFAAGGAGYGDPVQREAWRVAKDVRDGIVSLRMAEKLFGVVVGPESFAMDDRATEALRARIFKDRSAAPSYTGQTSSVSPERKSAAWEPVLRFHETLEVAASGTDLVIRCSGCSHLFCGADENYKSYSSRVVESLEDLAGHRMPSGEPYIGEFHRFYCPGCGVSLQSDVVCPAITESDEPYQDFWFTPQQAE
jgi:N-methylhydantoinase B